jgi:hypothetical protein
MTRRSSNTLWRSMSQHKDEEQEGERRRREKEREGERRREKEKREGERRRREKEKEGEEETIASATLFNLPK